MRRSTPQETRYLDLDRLIDAYKRNSLQLPKKNTQYGMEGQLRIAHREWCSAQAKTIAGKSRKAPSEGMPLG
jgi:hypothetical protein